jgi:PAS domain-containing protein
MSRHAHWIEGHGASGGSSDAAGLASPWSSGKDLMAPPPGAADSRGELAPWYLQILETLPAAIYATDAQGVVTFFNKAAADLAGRTPRLGIDRWCVTWRLYTSDGAPLPHDQCPMAIALKEKRAVRGAEAIA